ncbi:hypothetical protein HK096_003311 [Nowakowskiella sp. JEL0078]|nr:hypothetical protein HK096_003311 [Nowakowskiella sp. JEL0078]
MVKKKSLLSNDDIRDTSIPPLANIQRKVTLKADKAAVFSDVSDLAAPDSSSSSVNVDGLYFVEKILAKKWGIHPIKGNQCWLWLIKWVGFDEVANTWEPRENLDGCKETLKTFEKDWSSKNLGSQSELISKPNDPEKFKSKKRKSSKDKERNSFDDNGLVSSFNLSDNGFPNLSFNSTEELQLQNSRVFYDFSSIERQQFPHPSAE